MNQRNMFIMGAMIILAFEVIVSLVFSVPLNKMAAVFFLSIPLFILKEASARKMVYSTVFSLAAAAVVIFVGAIAGFVIQAGLFCALTLSMKGGPK